MDQSPVCLIDSGSYHYYRVSATLSWYNHQKGVEPPSLQNEVFLTRLREQYLSHLTKLLKTINRDLKCQITFKQIYSLRDCPRAEIWRQPHYPGYKGNRDSREEAQQEKLDQLDQTSQEYAVALGKQPGQFIKYLNTTMAHLFRQVIRVDRAEADDLVAVLTKYFRSLGRTVVIISLDSDFLQLYDKSGKVHLYNPKTCLPYQSDSLGTEMLHQKILKGDKSDCILPVTAKYGTGDYWFQYWKNSQMIDFAYIPMDLQRQIVNSLEPKLDFEFSSDWLIQPIQLGLCCKNTILQAQKIHCGHKPKLETILTRGMDYLLAAARQNLQDVLHMIEWNHQHGIRVFRMSSEIFPHKSNPKLSGYSLDQFQTTLQQIGNLARKYGQRLTFHPDHFNVIGTPDQTTFQKTIDDLDWQAETLDRMGMDNNSVMVIHGGGLYGNKSETIERWVKQFHLLPDRVKRRIVLENCERVFNIVDCLAISQQIHRPVVFDLHHHHCYQILHPHYVFESIETFIQPVLETWTQLNIKPKFHLSEQGEGKIGHHSDYIIDIPICLLEIPQKYHISIDIMIEAKMKEQAIFTLWKTYPTYFCKKPQVSYNVLYHDDIIPRE